MKFYCNEKKCKTNEHYFMSLSPLTFWQQFKAYSTK